jgi:hypothetical protein
MAAAVTVSAVLLALLLACVKPLGLYMARVFEAAGRGHCARGRGPSADSTGCAVSTRKPRWTGSELSRVPRLAGCRRAPARRAR